MLQGIPFVNDYVCKLIFKNGVKFLIFKHNVIMKNLTRFKLSILFLLLSLTVNAGPTPHPMMGNWLNPMNPGPPENLIESTYIYLNSLNSLNVELSVITTDDEVSLYDDLYLYYDFGGVYSDYILVTQEDLMEIEPDTGIYKAVYQLRLDFDTQCLGDTDGVMPILITLGLKTPKSPGIYDDYPFDSNQDLFDPAQYEELVSVINMTDKILLCWGTLPPGNMVSNDGEDIQALSETSLYNPLLNPPLNQEVQNQHKTEKTTIFPNPFSNTFQIEYTLDRPSDVQILIMNLSGKKLFHQAYSDQTKGVHAPSFDIGNDLSAGVYMAHIYHSGVVEVIKLVKVEKSK